MTDDLHHWPRGTTQREGAGIECVCADCRRRWRVHPSMGGFRLGCDCGAWLAVPGGDATVTAALPAPETGLGRTGDGTRGDDGAGAGSHLPAASRDARLASRRGEGGGTNLAEADRPAELADVRGSDGRALRRDPDGEWTLRFADVETQRKHNDATILWIVGLLGCFVVPVLLVHLLADPQTTVALFPVISVVSGLLVLVAVGAARVKAADLFRGAAAMRYVEAIVVASLGAAAAIGFVALLRGDGSHQADPIDTIRTELGLPMALFVVALCPGIFEELAFRGIVQPRLALHFGRVQGALMGGTAFALAHGITAGLPFHVAIGLWLSFLKDRSGSLLPGMLAHALYNGIIVVAS